MSDASDHAVFQLERPDRKLWIYYVLSSLVFGPFFFAALAPLYFRYQTLRYRFDEEGISMRWGILFRREIHLTYSRIQDIHLVANVVERWLGLARIQIQTASGSSKAEMVLEGLLEYELVRDFLYTRMRGARDTARSDPAGVAARPPEALDQRAPAGAAAAATGGSEMAALAAVLTEVAAELRAVRLALEHRRGDRAE